MWMGLYSIGLRCTGADQIFFFGGGGGGPNLGPYISISQTKKIKRQKGDSIGLNIFYVTVCLYLFIFSLSKT